MSVSSPFIHRPIATSLLGVAVMLGGLLGYLWLPVSSLPQVDFPTIQVTTQLPGASPDVMASLVTAPLERNFGQIPALQLMTSSSSFGVSQITLQFDLNRDIDAGPKGSLDGAHQSYTIAANDQITAASAYRNIIVTYRNGAPVRLQDVADVVDGLENTKVAGFHQGMPAIVVDIQRQPGANVIETVQRIKNELPKLQRAMPVGA